MKKTVLILLGMFGVLPVVSGCAGSQPTGKPFTPDLEALRVELAVNDWHLAASEGRFEDYFGLMTEDSVFLGTDASERWGKEEFMEYARVPFEDGHGWTYKSGGAHIAFSGNRRTAWVDELLSHEKYGELRGTGVLELIDREWKIAHYSLTFLVPNEKGSEVVEVIMRKD